MVNSKNLPLTTETRIVLSATPRIVRVDKYYLYNMGPASKSTDPKDLLKGGILQCMEAITVGMPFEVWKTHMGTYRLAHGSILKKEI